MTIGLLIYINNPTNTLPERVAIAAATYAKKHHGQTPDTCYIHPSAFNGHKPGFTVGPVTVLARKQTSPHYFWIGRATEEVHQCTP